MPETRFAARGSQRWLQMAVTRAPDLLRESLLTCGAIKTTERLEWFAPVPAENFAEPRDAEALRKAGIAELPVRSLGDFWPSRGPVWDAVGRAGNASVFVEAKAHVKESESPPSQASPASLARIKASLSEARSFYARGTLADWHLVYYQYANRLAHHYLLTQVNRMDSRLVFLYFLNDAEMRGPSSTHQWEEATARIHAALGLPGSLSGLGIHHAYLDVDRLRAST
jgi:hypothetical protein